MSDDVNVNKVVVPICEPCQKGDKGSCNMPECIFCRMNYDERPIMLDIYANVEWYESMAENKGRKKGLSAMREEIHKRVGSLDAIDVADDAFNKLSEEV